MNAPARSLSAARLRQFRTMLLAKRRELVGDIESIEDEELGDAGDLSTLPLHMADRATDSSGGDLLRMLAEHERELLWEIDEALQRLAAGRYGVCEATGGPIDEDRLEAIPWARCSIGAERERERS